MTTSRRTERRARALGSTLLATVAAALATAPAAAQEPAVDEMDLPRHVAEEVVAFFNDPATIRFNGRSSVPAGTVVRADVGVVGGPFTVGGTVEGDVIVLNGDLRMVTGARIDGDLTVIGGTILDRERGEVTGTVAVYGEALRYRERDGELAVREEDEGVRGLRWGRARITVRSASSYNRVEGLPVLFGPTFRTAEPDPFHFEALGLWRTASGFGLDDEELGWVIRAEQRIGSRPGLTFGAGAHSRVDPVESWGLGSLESSLATFLLHKDYRDHVEREGWSAWLGLHDEGAPLQARVEYRREEHGYVPVSSPWTLRKNDEPWRPQPLVAEGELETLTGELVYDDRNDPDDPTDGWFGTLRLTRGLDGDLRTPASAPTPTGPVVPGSPVDHGFTSAFLDVRRYNRVGPTSDLSFRLVYGGTVDGDPLPSQFQHALGGEGSLPGYRLFHGDCGARTGVRYLERASFDDEEDPLHAAFPRYGCDRAVLFQVEYRSTFDVTFDLGPDDDEEWDEEWDWYPAVDLTPAWSFFFDAGRGWTENEGGVDTSTLADVGLGLFLGDLGLYWSYPLGGEERSVNFFLRLQRRF